MSSDMQAPKLIDPGGLVGEAHAQTAPVDKRDESLVSAKASRHLAALTGLRMLAALAVYMSHLGPPHSSPAALTAFVTSGYMGVTVFFTLSGFVLALNYFENLRSFNLRRTWEYATARFARIYPLYILLLFYILVRRHAFGEDITGWWEHVLALQAWDQSVAQAYNFNGPAWSVSVEFFLYACFPLLVVVLARLRSTRSITTAAAAVILGMGLLTLWFVASGRGNLPWIDPESAHRWLYRDPLSRLGDFTLGILAARFYAQNRGRPALVKVGGLAVAIAGVATIALMSWPATVYSAWSWDVLYVLPAVLVILGLAIAPLSLPARILSLPVAVLLGESSYAFYLIHQSALAYFGADRWSIATSATTIIYELLTLGAIICLAVGLHVMVERPARRYIRRLVKSPGQTSEKSPWHGPHEVLP